MEETVEKTVINSDSTKVAAKTSPSETSSAKSSKKAETVPEAIGKYKIHSLIAKGGMGAVYRSVHPSLKRPVILKKLTIRNNKIVRERFKREAQILLDLQSPYIVHVYDYFIEGQSHYIVEEFVEGVALDKLISKQISLGTELSLLVFLDACYALKYAHSKNIVHRDIKPGNILISKRAEVKLADFGIASTEKESVLPPESKSESGENSTQSTAIDENLTQSGVMLGTPAYMSPEQIGDSRSVDNRADIYSMGVMLYEMITGTKPYPSTFSGETLKKIRKGQYVSPRKIDKNVPLVICHLIRKMLKFDPKARYQTMDPIIRIVRKYLKKYDTHEIRVNLAKCVLSAKQFKVPLIQKKKQTVRNISIGVAAAFILCAGVFRLWSDGFFHKTILSHWYKPVTMEISLPETASADADVPVRAFFFIDDRDKIPEIPGTRRVLSPQSTSLKVKSYGIKTVYLKDGNYRVKIAAGPYIMWQSFTMDGEPLNLKFKNLRNERRNLKFTIKSFDRDTGKDLTSKTEFSLSYKGRWVKMEEVPLSELKTGTVWKIRARTEEYRDEIFSLMIDWYQDDVFINAALSKN